MVDQIQATQEIMETKLINLENDRRANNYRGHGREIGTSFFLLSSHIQEQVTHNDLNERLLHVLERYQFLNTGIKADILKFQGKFEMESEVDQIEYEERKDQPAKNLTTNLSTEDKSDRDQTIELENNQLFQCFHKKLYP